LIFEEALRFVKSNNGRLADQSEWLGIKSLIDGAIDLGAIGIDKFDSRGPAIGRKGKNYCN
jgi:hypothetical protein